MTRILVVDDDPMIVEGLVAGALDRETAEAALAAEFYPVVLADLRLRSEEEGWRLLDAIARMSPTTRVASLEAAQAEDLEEVYRQTSIQLAGLARKRYGIGADEAQDILHEAWCLFLEKRASVRAPKAWLSGTVVNLCRRWIEDRVRWRGPDIDDVDRPAGGGDMETTLVARDALAQVDARTRRLCQLIAVEGLRYDEVSKAMQIPIGSVGPLYMRAKKKMRDVLR